MTCHEEFPILNNSCCVHFTQMWKAHGQVKRRKNCWPPSRKQFFLALDCFEGGLLICSIRVKKSNNSLGKYCAPTPKTWFISSHNLQMKMPKSHLIFHLFFESIHACHYRKNVVLNIKTSSSHFMLCFSKI